MTNISIEQFDLSKGNPFILFPTLTTIWSKESFNIAFEAFDEEKIEMNNQPNLDYGEIFLIKNDNTNQVIGITGYFHCDNEIWLRWHGITEEFRNKGISKAVLNFVIEKVKEKYPSADGIVEFMPISEKHKTVSNYFTKIGFIKIGQPEIVDFSHYQYQKYKKHFNVKPLDTLNQKKIKI